MIGGARSIHRMDGWMYGQMDRRMRETSGVKYGVNKLLGRPMHRLEYSI
jgi:hypothetical protein